jgi:tRNA uridine 5-carboxymethylaminomethyl modification enzyme
LVETDVKYQGYAIRQREHNQVITKRLSHPIPDGTDFSAIAGLSSETRQKLSRVKPTTLGQANRVSGVTPADISILSIWLAKNSLRHQKSETVTTAD